MTEYFTARRDFQEDGSVYIAGQTYKLHDHLAEKVDRWRGAGLVEVEGDHEVPPQPQPLVVKVERPRPVRVKGSRARDVVVTAKVQVQHDTGIADPDAVRVHVIPSAFTTDELRAMFDQILATLEATR